MQLSQPHVTQIEQVNCSGRLLGHVFRGIAVEGCKWRDAGSGFFAEVIIYDDRVQEPFFSAPAIYACKCLTLCDKLAHECPLSKEMRIDDVSSLTSYYMLHMSRKPTPLRMSPPTLITDLIFLCFASQLTN